jgi:hypothetical protein
MITPKLLLYNQIHNANENDFNELILHMLDYLGEKQCEMLLYKALPLVKGKLSDILIPWRRDQANGSS